MVRDSRVRTGNGLNDVVVVTVQNICVCILRAVKVHCPSHCSSVSAAAWFLFPQVGCLGVVEVGEINPE